MLPSDNKLEVIVLGSMLIDKDVVSRGIQILRVETFCNAWHKNIFTAIAQLHEEGIVPDIQIVYQQLRKNRGLVDGNGAYHVSILTNNIGSTGNFEVHCRVLLQIFLRREYVMLGGVLQKIGFNETTDPLEEMNTLQSKIDTLIESVHLGKTINPEESKKQLKEQMAQARKAKDGVTGVPSGFPRIDKLTGGWQKTDFIVVAARPGMGKTAFIIMCLINMVKAGHRVVMFSLEMSTWQIMMRMASMELEIELENILKGRTSDEEAKSINDYVDNISDNLIIDDTPALSIVDLRARVRRYSLKGLDLIVIDYLQLMTGSGNSREEVIANVSRKCKQTAKEFNIPLIALAQLSRKVEDRTKNDKTPQLSDLRESGAIEQDADSVIFQYRPDYYNITEDNYGNSLVGVCKMIWAKHRNGRLATIPMNFEGKFVKFSDVTKIDTDAESGETDDIHEETPISDVGF